MKRWIVRVESEERERLRQVVRGGKAAAYRIRHANVLLAVDESEGGPSLPDAQVAETLRISVRAIESLRRRFVEEGLEACLAHKKQGRPSVEPIFDGEKEAKLIAVACGSAGRGGSFPRQTQRLDRTIPRSFASASSAGTIGRQCHPDALRPAGHHHPGDGVRRHPREPAA